MPTQQEARDALQKLISRYYNIPLADRLALTESDILENLLGVDPVWSRLCHQRAIQLLRLRWI